MKMIFLMAAVLLTACGGWLDEVAEPTGAAGQARSELKDASPGPTVPSPLEMCLLACAGLPDAYRVRCLSQCTMDEVDRIPDRTGR